MQNAHLHYYGEKRTLDAFDYEIYYMNDSSSSKVRLHSHDFFEVFYLCSGSMDYIVEGRRYTLGPGCLLLIPPNELHRPEISSVCNFERIVLWIAPSILMLLSQQVPGLFSELLACSQLSHHLSPQVIPAHHVEGILRALLHEYRSDEECRTVMCRMLVFQVLLLVKRALSSLRQDAAEQASAASYSAYADNPQTALDLDHVFRYINAHLTDDLTVSNLAERFFFNENTLSRRFKKHAGVTVAEYIRQKRLTMARLCIYQGMSAAQAGASSGFSDYTTFYRAFRREYGTSPKAFAESVLRASPPFTAGS